MFFHLSNFYLVHKNVIHQTDANYEYVVNIFFWYFMQKKKKEIF